MTLHTTTHDAGETHALGQRLGALLRAGDVVVLDGELGTGKTVVAKGIAVALGITDPVVSPTFTVVREYDASLPLVHVDVYRLDHLQELHDLGFDDLVGGEAVTVVEWGERVSAVLPVDRLEHPPRRPVSATTTGWCRSTRRASRGRRGSRHSPARWEADVLLLALDTSTTQVSVAIGDGGAVLGSVALVGGRRHAEQLAPAIDYLRTECRVALVATSRRSRSAPARDCSRGCASA